MAAGRDVIIQLRHGDAVPSGEPRRYTKKSNGYVVLRWKVGTRRYVEAYEHRLLLGLPPDGVQIHHINGIKTDNRADNLALVTAASHTRIHNPREYDVEAAARDYRAGINLPELSRKYGIDNGALSRGLRAHGVVMRTSGESKRKPADAARITELHSSGMRAPRIAQVCGMSVHVVRRVITSLGLPAHPVGRAGKPELEAAGG